MFLQKSSNKIKSLSQGWWNNSDKLVGVSPRSTNSGLPTWCAMAQNPLGYWVET